MQSVEIQTIEDKDFDSWLLAFGFRCGRLFFYVVVKQARVRELRIRVADFFRFARIRSGIAPSCGGVQIASWSLEVHNRVHQRHARLWKPRPFNDLEDES